ncbi:site-specific integrase [Geodermatophilus chilensis]|uniref:site-specific integrase n=1 Tax=Geodermatophilus chilensis TaxID=2035835 RepID=UPI001E315F55|nr:site-specific integrase [Geodermatophilus chilensis]
MHTTPSGHRAVAWYRDYDGRCRQVERHAKTKAAAEAALRLALRDRARFDVGGDITPNTRVDALAEAWFAGLKNLSPTTMQAYRNRLDQQVLPGLGNLRVRELSIGTIERHLCLVSDKHGPAVAKMTKSVLSGVCGLAARHDALERNPVRDTGSIETPAKKAPKALTADEARTLLTELEADERTRRHDVPDFIAFMLATGCRIGEAAAVTWDDLDLDAGTVDIRSTIVRVKGQGLVRKSTKTASGARTLLLPPWCVEKLRRRAARVGASTDVAGAQAPVFSAPLGGWRDPSNTQADLRAAFAGAGFGHISSHVIRKTTATMLDHAGLSARAIADQLGHANPSLTQDVYLGRQVASTGAAMALEALRPTGSAQGLEDGRD